MSVLRSSSRASPRCTISHASCGSSDRESSAIGLVPDDLDEPAPVTLAVELEEEHALPGPQAELALTHGDRLAGGAEQHRHAVRVAVPDVHVLLADVLGASVPVVVRVIVLAAVWHEPLEEGGEVLEEAGLE